MSTAAGEAATERAAILSFVVHNIGHSIQNPNDSAMTLCWDLRKLYRSLARIVTTSSISGSSSGW